MLDFPKVSLQGPIESEPPAEHPESGDLGLCIFTWFPDFLYLEEGKSSIHDIRPLLSSMSIWIASPTCLCLLVESQMQPILGSRLRNTV